MDHTKEDQLRHNIVVEGMDGSGKDTLIAELMKLYPLKGRHMRTHPRFCTSIGGPVARGDELAALVSDDALRMPDNGLTVYNRHPIISEPIYCVLRDGPQGVWASTAWVDSWKRFLGRYCAVVLCQPPLEHVRANLLRDENGQMSGVIDNMDSLYEKYAELHWPGPIIRYNYTKDTAATVVRLLERVMD
jgi:hypothetical protein